MTQKALIILPGALLPEDCATQIFDSLPKPEKHRLGVLFSPFSLSKAARFSPMPFARASHLMWLWRYLTKEESYPETAPASWLATGAPSLNIELWELSFLSYCDTQELKLTENEVFELFSELKQAANAVEAKLQISSTKIFLSFNTPLQTVAAPARTLNSETLSEAIYGPEENRHKNILLKLDSILSPTIEKIFKTKIFSWIHGGGLSYRFKPSEIRAIYSDDEIICSWAQMAGIPTSNISTTQIWPKAPSGDRIFVISNLYDAWLASDWQMWGKNISQTLDKLEEITKKAKEEKFDEIHLILFGYENLAMYSPKEENLLSRLFKQSKLFEANPFFYSK